MFELEHMIFVFLYREREHYLKMLKTLIDDIFKQCLAQSTKDKHSKIKFYDRNQVDDKIA